MADERVFTDDRISILKNVSLTHTGPIWMSHSELEALLYRLACAEAYAEFRDYFPPGHDGERERYEAWERSCGK